MLFVFLLANVLILITSAHSGISPESNTAKTGVLDEIYAEIPYGSKDGLYYFIILMFVVSTVASTLLTGAFIVLAILLWGHFRPMKFFWLLTQLTCSVFIVSILNLVINVPATLFSLITREFVQSDAFLFVSYLLDVCHYTILFTNLVIAVHRFFVFFLRRLTDKVFDVPGIYAWLISVWIFSALIVFVMMNNNCRYQYKNSVGHYVLYCEPKSSIVDLPTPVGLQALELLLQIMIPVLIFCIYIALTVKILIMKRSLLNKNEVAILKQAFVIFLLFQISSLVFLFCQTFTFDTATAFLVKRIINTAEIFAGAATPCFFFFTSKDIRKLISTKVSAVSSQTSSQVQQRRRTLRVV